MDVSKSLEVRWAQGLSSSKTVFVDETTACYSCGNHIIFLDVETQIRKVLQSPGHGIGVFTASGLCKTLAFSDQRLFPSIFVYRYPELSLRCELKGEAKLAYTALALSDTGPYLASCSSLPDYTITVWDLERGNSVCSSRLAEEDVTTLLFNPRSWQQICAINLTSLSVWNIERSNEFHFIKPSIVDLPGIDGSVTKQEVDTSYNLAGPQMPTSAIAGLSGDRADRILPLIQVKPRLCPSAICWSISSDLYVGTKEGFLLLVNTKSLLVFVLHNPHVKQSLSDCSKSLEGSFQSLALHSKGLFATGHDGLLQTLEIKGNKMKVLETLDLDEPVSSLCFSPDYETLLLSSSNGCIYKYNPGLKKEVLKILDVMCGDFIAAAPVYTEMNLCVSVRESGELQLWSLDNGDCISSIFLQTKVTCLACCPIAQYVAVGTVTGHVLFVDLTRAQKPRLVHTVHLYHVPVKHLVFDLGTHFLITGAFDSHIFFLDARPSKAFEIIGYTDTMGSTVSLSTQYHKESKKVDVLVLCNSEKRSKTDEKFTEGNLMMLLSVSTQQISDAANCIDPYGCLQEQVVQTRVYEVTHSLSSCVLAAKAIFGYCHQKKVLQRFQLPQSGNKTSRSQKAVTLNPQKEAEGHPFGPALLCLSPHQRWLASVARDGLLRIHDVNTLEKIVEKQCHSWWLGGIRSVSFTLDSQTLITTGLRDGSLVCSGLCLKMAAGIQDGESMLASFQQQVSQENPILSDMADWEAPAQTQTSAEACNRGQVRHDKTDNDEGCHSLSSISACSSTWLDDKLNAVLKEESQQYAENMQSLRQSTQELRGIIQAMMQENEKLQDMEKLEQLEFNLDVEEQQRLQTEGEQEVIRMRKEMEHENVAKRYQHGILKKKYWDSMDVKWKVIKAFYSGYEVDNFPMKERTAKELEELARIEAMRENEEAASSQVLENITSPLEGDEDEENKWHEVISALPSSLSAQYGGSNPHLPNQFSLHTRDQIHNHIILIQDVMYKVKTAFNKEFEAVYKQKEQEINRVRDKNKRITEIMSKLELQETLWEPTLSDSERPERALTVSDSEIKVEKYLTPEQRQREEKQRKEEEQKKLASKGDNIRVRGLDDMMGGVLEVKAEDILSMEVPPPEFIIKEALEWTEEERTAYNEYERKVIELSEEKEKYKKTLLAEMKKLQASTKDATQAFDETLRKLSKRKLKSEMVLYQEELKITNLLHSLLIEEEMSKRAEELSYRLEKAQGIKTQIWKTLNNHKEDVEAFQEMYDNTVIEDNFLDSEFRKEFSDVPRHIIDWLYKLYKRRPRVQIMKTQTDKTGLFKESSMLSQATLEGHTQMMKAMEQLDAPQNMPEGLDPAVWERLCLARRTKVESENKIKMDALTLVEMQTFLQKRKDEAESSQTEIKNIAESIVRLQEQRSNNLLDIMVQILLKQGQVEVEIGDFAPDYTGSLLLHRSVVEDLNDTIRGLGEQKIASMVKCKDFHKGFIQMEWDHKRMSKQIEDLKQKARDIQMLYMSHEVQEYLTEIDKDKALSKKLYALEAEMMLQEKIHTQNVESYKKLIKNLNKQAKRKKEKSEALDMQLIDMQLMVEERRNIYDSTTIEESQEHQAKQRYKNILQRKKFMDLAKAQARNIAILHAELQCLLLKTYPTFP